MKVHFVHDSFFAKFVLGLIYRRFKYDVYSSSDCLSIYFVSRRVTTFLLPSFGLEQLTQSSFLVCTCPYLQQVLTTRNKRISIFYETHLKSAVLTISSHRLLVFRALESV